MNFDSVLAKPQANLIAGEQITNEIYRFRAEVSSLAPGWKDAIAACLGSDLKLVTQATFEVAGKRQSGVGHTIEAFAVYAPTSHFVSKAEMAATLETMKVRKVAANLYMGADETIWKVTEAGNSVSITKDGNDDINELLASANSNHFDHSFVSELSKSGMGEIAYVHKNGMIEAGIAVGRVKGDLNRIQAFSIDDLKEHGKKAVPVILSTLQVVAFEDFKELEEPEDFNGFDPLEYYRALYSNDPETMRTLEEFAEGMNLEG